MASSITSQIVQVNAQVTPAPAVSTLQQSGALISLGGTTITANSYQYFSSLTDLEAVLSTTGNYQEVQNMATTFFAQGTAVGVYVLELGVQTTPAEGVTALETWIASNPGVFYAYLLPATWDSAATNINTLAATYSGVAGKTYFFTTTTSGTISGYTGTNKALVLVVNSPSAGATEFQAAAFFYNWLANNPSAASPAAPMNFRFAYGVTPWAQLQNQTTITTILTAYGNVILSGAEGGISTALLRNATTLDGNQMMFWYGVDYVLINGAQDLAAAIIDGSNSNPPLYYNQIGINRLLAVLNNRLATAVSSGLLLSGTGSATSFSAYKAANPTDYSKGKYNGLSATVTPQAGFEQITFNLDAVAFA